MAQRRAAIVAVSLAVSGLGLAAAPGEQIADPPEMFEMSGGGEENRAPDVWFESGSIARARTAAVRAPAMAALAGDEAAITLDLFDDVVLQASGSPGETIAGSRTWLGTIEGDPGSDVIFVIGREGIVGHVTSARGVFEIRPLPGTSVHRIYEIDLSGFRDHGPGYDPGSALAGSIPVEEESAAGDQPVATQKVMVVYTAPAQGGVAAAAWKDEIALAVAQANSAYNRSGVDVHLELVASRSVDWSSEASLSLEQIRDALKVNGDDIMDDVHGWRARSSADIVVLLVDDRTDGCGIAYIPGLGETPAFPAYKWAFAVVDESCATTNKSFVHEIGHLQGAGHATTQSPVGSRGPGAEPFAAGWQMCPEVPANWDLSYTDADAFRTIMAYRGPCTSAPRILRFSSPDLVWQEMPGGSEDVDNVRMLQQSANIVSGYMPLPHNQADELFFYDTTSSTTSNGDVAFFDVSAEGALSLLNKSDKWRRDWDIIVPLDMDGDGDDELMLYDTTSSTSPNADARFYDVSSTGKTRLIKASDAYRSTWDMIVPLDLNGDGDDELLFYDKDSPTSDYADGHFYDVSATGALTPIRTGNMWRVDWDMIVPLDLNGDGDDELLLYDTTSDKPDNVGFGDGRFYDVSATGVLSKIRFSTRWRADYDQIVALDLNGDGDDELFMYDSTSNQPGNDGYGDGYFYDVTSSGVLVKIRGGTHYRTGWDIILGVEIEGDADDEIMFYDAKPGSGDAAFYSVTPSGGLVAIRSTSGYREDWDVILPIRLKK